MWHPEGNLSEPCAPFLLSNDKFAFDVPADSFYLPFSLKSHCGSVLGRKRKPEKRKKKLRKGLRKMLERRRLSLTCFILEAICRRYLSSMVFQEKKLDQHKPKVGMNEFHFDILICLHITGDSKAEICWFVKVILKQLTNTY